MKLDHFSALLNTNQQSPPRISTFFSPLLSTSPARRQSLEASVFLRPSQNLKQVDRRVLGGSKNGLAEPSEPRSKLIVKFADFKAVIKASGPANFRRLRHAEWPNHQDLKQVDCRVLRPQNKSIGEFSEVEKSGLFVYSQTVEEMDRRVLRG